MLFCDGCEAGTTQSERHWRARNFDDLDVHLGGQLGQAMDHRREIVLLVDTFNRYFEPENARAAERLLTRAGYRVTTPEPLVEPVTYDA